MNKIKKFFTDDPYQSGLGLVVHIVIAISVMYALGNMDEWLPKK